MSVTQGVAAQAFRAKDWAREFVDISGAFVTALNVGTLFGHVALPSKDRTVFFLPFESLISDQISDALTVCSSSL